MALSAGDSNVLSSERVAGFGVIERLLVELGALPRGGVVALQAVGAKAALVVILVTGAARSDETHPGAIQVLALKQRPFGGGYVLCGVATAASRGGVLAIEHITGLRVVKPLRRGVPMDHVEVLAVVIRMAFDACRAGRSGQRIGGVQAMVAVHFGGDLAMTLRAAERRGSRGDGVALGAVGGAVEALMRPCQRTRRDLTVQHEREEKCGDSSPREPDKHIQNLSVSNCSRVHRLPCVPGWLWLSASRNAVRFETRATGES